MTNGNGRRHAGHVGQMPPARNRTVTTSYQPAQSEPDELLRLGQGSYERRLGPSDEDVRLGMWALVFMLTLIVFAILLVLGSKAAGGWIVAT